MNMQACEQALQRLRIIPVVVLDHVDDAIPLADALLAGGLPAAEITFRTDAAEASIRRIKAQHADMLVGAGTVCTPEQAARALDAGADFLVSPGFSAPVAEYARMRGAAIVPGCCTPTDILAAMGFGLDILKFFPANLYGGLQGIKALSPVFPTLRFMPTGGVSLSNLAEYLSFDRIIAVGGTWMVKGDLIRAGSFDKIEQLTREAVLQARL